MSTLEELKEHLTNVTLEICSRKRGSHQHHTIRTNNCVAIKIGTYKMPPLSLLSPGLLGKNSDALIRNLQIKSSKMSYLFHHNALSSRE